MLGENNESLIIGLMVLGIFVIKLLYSKFSVLTSCSVGPKQKTAPALLLGFHKLIGPRCLGKTMNHIGLMVLDFYVIKLLYSKFSVLTS